MEMLFPRENVCGVHSQGTFTLCGCQSCPAWRNQFPIIPGVSGTDLSKNSKMDVCPLCSSKWFKDSMMLTISQNVQGCLDTWGLLSFVRDQNWKASRLGDVLTLPERPGHGRTWWRRYLNLWPERSSLQADAKGETPQQNQRKEGLGAGGVLPRNEKTGER